MKPTKHEKEYIHISKKRMNKFFAYVFLVIALFNYVFLLEYIRSKLGDFISLWVFMTFFVMFLTEVILYMAYE
jgi:hypothetical protein